MMKRFRGLFLLTSCIVALSAPSAMAGIGLDLLGAAVMPMATGSPTPTGRISIPGGGANLRFRLGSRVSFEVGANYLSRTYAAAGGGGTVGLLNYPVGLQLMLARFFFIEGGGYYNLYLTNPRSLTGADIGLFGGAGIRVPFSPSFALQVNAQYHYALTTLTYTGGSLSAHEAVAFAGFSIGMNTLGGK